MNFNVEARTRILADVTSDIDPTGSTVDVKVDGQWYPAAWIGTPVVTSTGRWTQTAQTVAYFAGPLAPAAGATVLTAGRHATKTRVIKGNDVLIGVGTHITVSTP